jgi:hypothetical protein
MMINNEAILEAAMGLSSGKASSLYLPELNSLCQQGPLISREHVALHYYPKNLPNKNKISANWAL